MPGCSLREWAMCRSEPQTPHASTRRTRSVGRGVGSGSSVIVSQGSVPIDTAARIQRPSAGRSRAELQVQARDTAQDERRDVAVAAGTGGAVVLLRDPDLTQPVEQPLDADPAFGAGELAAHAGVHAPTEGEVLTRVLAVDAEL